MKDDMNISILVCYHKEFAVYRDPAYMPIHVGRSLSPFRLDMAGDDTGDNISAKNASFCELTAMYWAWKNLKGVDFIGLCHYRRFFDFHNVIPSVYSYKYEDVERFGDYDFSITDGLKKELAAGGVVVANPYYMKRSVFEHYCMSHVPDDLKKLRDIIHADGEREFIEAFDRVMLGNSLSLYNMFVMSWADFDGYCSWLFGILFRLESKIDITDYSPYQRRVFGFMAERLLSVYLIAKRKERLYYPVVQFVDAAEVNNHRPVRQFFSVLNKRVRFMLKPQPEYYRD